jgi:hypothetical protein
MRNFGLRPARSAEVELAKTIAAAPSFMLDAFPAVTVPSFWNTVRSPAKISGVVSFGYSSTSKFTISRFTLISTGVI